MACQSVLKKKMNNKLLVNINNLADIETYKKIGITNFLFAVKDFSLSNHTFNLSELKALNINIYLNFNRILDTKEIEAFKKIKKDLSFASGILYEDLGIYQVLKDSKIPLIWNQKHFVINSRSINFWLERVDSAVISNELTKDEIKSILENTQKPLIIPIFGYNQAMYARRKLLTSFGKAKKIKTNYEAHLVINDKHAFNTKEIGNETVFNYHLPFNYLPYLKDFKEDKIKFYLIDSDDKPEDIIKLINGHHITSNEQFLSNKTIYKLED